MWSENLRVGSGECGVQVLNNNDLSSFYFVFVLHHAMSSMGTLIILGEYSELSVWKVKTLHFQSHDKVDYHETVCVSRSLSSLWHPDCCHPEGCHHDQKPTEGAREGHSNGQEIAHQQKNRQNITGFKLTTRRWRLIWGLLLFYVISQSCDEQFFSLLINRSYLSYD